MLDNLNKQFNKQFGQLFGNLNTKLIKTNKTDNKYYEVPYPVVGDGGGTLIKGDGPVTLDAAEVKFVAKKMEPVVIIYTVKISLEDAAKAAEDEGYFNYLFIPVVEQVIYRYQKTFGPSNTIRYGTVFCTPGQPGKQPFVEEGENILLSFYGDWASNKEYTNV